MKADKKLADNWHYWLGRLLMIKATNKRIHQVLGEKFYKSENGKLWLYDIPELKKLSLEELKTLVKNLEAK